ncbi:UNKNOWN [Stylonychia lemnae]|uniref:Uncharacterized protein n=1 Tax=Stylonychia lemnae TaxID=5949 RepID=A0A077ZZY8_STYLE|nr:UNKNOWN [Stylonychia lemnae]|eukprot:CDW75470.1 UNKNOWN [Stylonychia lemnae]
MLKESNFKPLLVVLLSSLISNCQTYEQHQHNQFENTDSNLHPSFVDQNLQTQEFNESQLYNIKHSDYRTNFQSRLVSNNSLVDDYLLQLIKAYNKSEDYLVSFKDQIKTQAGKIVQWDSEFTNTQERSYDASMARDIRMQKPNATVKSTVQIISEQFHLSGSLAMAHLKDVESYFTLGFKPALDYKGSWMIDKKGDTITRQAHENRETIGDMKVMFYTLKEQSSIKEDRKLVMSIIGKQVGNSIANDDHLMISIGKKSLKQIIHEEQRPIQKKQYKIRLAILFCIFLIQYSVLIDLIRLFFGDPYSKEGKNGIVLTIGGICASAFVCATFTIIAIIIEALV